MKKSSLLMYILTISLNFILLLPVFFTYGILAPIHVLIYWLSFNKIFSNKSFISNWSCIKIATVGFISQWLFFLFISFLNGVENISLLDFLTNPLFILFLILTSLEFFVLFFTYSRFLNKHSSQNASS